MIEEAPGLFGSPLFRATGLFVTVFTFCKPLQARFFRYSRLFGRLDSDACMLPVLVYVGFNRPLASSNALDQKPLFAMILEISVNPG